ncbi:MAG: hypothetical protein FD134_1689 [Gallionellaceae bacterium]|nr:MAG: hypothetical protein FD134_1689 [Gallionellaceae bacterium]
MKIADHIKHSLDACDSRELDKAMLFACLAVDGTAKKMYPQIGKVGERFRRFIVEHLDIIELMFGGLNLQETVFPFKGNKGNVGREKGEKGARLELSRAMRVSGAIGGRLD